MARRTATQTKAATQKKAISKDNDIPTPFTKAPTSLNPLLDLLDPTGVYITHIDRHPIDTKKQIFLIPVLLNGTIALLLFWRLYAALPTYWSLTQTLLGHASSATVDVTHTTRAEQFWILGRRTFMFTLDFLTFRFIGPWPLTFFFEQPANPITWRWRLGVRAEEVVVRVSRGWGMEDLMQGVKQGEENAFFKTRVLPAIETEMMRKTGYLMMDRSWDLDFAVMIDAHTLVEKGELRMAEVDKMVLVHQDGVGWVVWEWEGEGGVGEKTDVVEARRKKVVAFKVKLTMMGKEALFWKWMEIVEEERDADGGFTVERQQKVAEKVQREFERNGVDFDELTRSVGGLEEMPTTKGT